MSHNYICIGTFQGTLPTVDACGYANQLSRLLRNEMNTATAATAATAATVASRNGEENQGVSFFQCSMSL